MQLHYLQRHEIDDTQWNNCIDRCSTGLPYSYTWHLDIVAQQQWAGIVADDYTAVFPLPYRRRLHLHYIYQPAWTQQLGIFAPQTLTPATVDAFWATIPKRYVWTDMYINEQHPPPTPTAVLSYHARTNYILDLSPSYETLRKNYRNNHLQNLQKAKKHDLYIDTLPIELLLQTARPLLLQKNVRLQDFHFEQLRQLVYHAQQHEIGKTLAVRDRQQQLHAVHFHWYSKQRIVNLMSLSTEMGRHSGATFGLIDYLVQQYSNSPCILDFEGGNEAGMARFFAGFGAIPITYWHVTRNQLPFYLRWWKQKST